MFETGSPAKSLLICDPIYVSFGGYTKSKTSGRRKSFCARMGGMKKRLTSAKTARDPNSRINKALRKWDC